MTTALALTESSALRAETATLVPDAVYQIPGFSFPEGRAVLARQEVAAAFGVADDTLRKQVSRHKAELQTHGMKTLTSKASVNSDTLSDFFPKAGKQVLDVFPPTAVTIVGMLLTESEVAAQFRTAIIRKLQAPVECSQPHVNNAGRKRLAGRGTPFVDQVIRARELGLAYVELPSGFKMTFRPDAPVPDVKAAVREVVMDQYNATLADLGASAEHLTRRLKADITQEAVAVGSEEREKIVQAKVAALADLNVQRAVAGTEIYRMVGDIAKRTSAPGRGDDFVDPDSKDKGYV